MNRRTIAAALVLASAASAMAQPGDRTRVQADSARAAARLEALHREADQLAGEARTLLSELRSSEVARQIAIEELRRAEEASAAAASELTSLDSRVQQVSAEIESALPALRRRLIELYKLGEARYLRMLLSTADVRHAGQASRTVAMLAQDDRARVEERRQLLDALAISRTQLIERQEQLAGLEREAEQAAAAAAAAVREHSALLRRINERRDLTAQLAGELQAAQQSLQTTLQAIANGDAVSGSSLPIAPFQGALAWPVEGQVRRRFSGSGSTPASSGIEIAAAEGLDVRAVHGGTVAFAESFAGLGNLVIVEHDRQNFTLYGHLLHLAVARGDRVESGQVLGSVGLSPAGQAGLYFEVRIDARPVDPLQWLRTR